MLLGNYAAGHKLNREYKTKNPMAVMVAGWAQQVEALFVLLLFHISHPISHIGMPILFHIHNQRL
jgi:hypothetical protein